MNIEDCNEFVEKFLAEVPYLDDEVDKYVNDYLIKKIKTADEGVHRLFFPSVPRKEEKMGEVSTVPKLSVLCVANILSVCNESFISAQFEKSCDRQINEWFQLNGLETGQEIFKNFLESKLQISTYKIGYRRECIKALFETLTKPHFRQIMQIFARTNTPVPAQLIVSAMKALDCQYGELLIQKWLSETPKGYKDFEWWDSFQQMQMYPWFHGVGASFFCDAIESDVKKVLRDNVKGIKNWIDSVNGPNKYGLLN